MRLGIIAEGTTDPPVVKKIINKVIREYLGLDWPARFEDFKEFRIRKTGFGGVVAKLKALIFFLNQACDPKASSANESYYQDIYCIFIDNGCGRKANAEAISEIKGLIRANPNVTFVLGIPKEEVEAWVIADYGNVLSHLGYQERRGREIERPEEVVDPKAILVSWIREAEGYVYNRWDGNAADDIAEVLDVRVLSRRCRVNFRPWKDQLIRELRSKAGRLL